MHRKAFVSQIKFGRLVGRIPNPEPLVIHYDGLRGRYA